MDFEKENLRLIRKFAAIAESLEINNLDHRNKNLLFKNKSNNFKKTYLYEQDQIINFNI